MPWADLSLSLLFCLGLQGCHPGQSKPSHCSQVGSHGHRMDCGPGVSVCGVLTLETGQGHGAYHHREPVVHGLWPQVNAYGDSQCVSPKNREAPHRVYKCYDQAGESEASNLGFERHEWLSHGVCAGAVDAEDFFTQVCSLAEGPLHVMASARAADLDLVDTVDTLQRSGHCVWHMGSNSQIQLSACLSKSGWKLADVANFAETCGEGSLPPAPPGPSVGSCVPGQHGPKCESNADCLGLSGCVRCAKSGFCTDVKLTHSTALAALQPSLLQMEEEEPTAHSVQMQVDAKGFQTQAIAFVGLMAALLLAAVGGLSLSVYLSGRQAVNSLHQPLASD